MKKKHPNIPQWPEWMTADVAAHYLGSSQSTLAKLRIYGGGPKYGTIGRAVRYRRSDLDEWMMSKKE